MLSCIVPDYATLRPGYFSALVAAMGCISFNGIIIVSSMFGHNEQMPRDYDWDTSYPCSHAAGNG